MLTHNTSHYFCEVQIREGSVPKLFAFKFIWMTKCMRLANDFLPKVKVLAFQITMLPNYNSHIV